MMCSSELLENKVKGFCNKNRMDEAIVWTILNKIHTRDYGKNVMYEKNQYEMKNNLADIPMAEYFGQLQMVNNAIRVLDGMDNCLRNGWEME